MSAIRSSQLIFPSPTSEARMVEAMGFENEAISKTVSESTGAGSPTLRTP